MTHDLVVTPHPLTLQGRTITRAAELQPGDTLADLLGRHGVSMAQPGWCVRIGGAEVPAMLWSRTRPHHGQLIEAHRVAGDGDDIRGILRIVAVAVLAYFTMGAGLGAGGLGGSLGYSGFAAYAINVGAFIVGSMIINKVLPPPSLRTPGYGDRQTGATYSLQGARNQARHFEPLGLLMGQVRVAPDFAAQPYSWFWGEDQYQYVQLHAGLNVDTVTDLKVGATSLDAYDDVTVWRVGFGDGSPEPTNWESVDTVAGALLDAPTAPGAWVVRTSSANTVQLQIDLGLQLYKMGDNGSPVFAGVFVDAEYRLLPAGAWLPFSSYMTNFGISSHDTKPLRLTYSQPVAAGQYEVRMRKLTANASTNREANVIEWSTLKSYQADTADYIGRKTVGIKIKASGQLNGTLDQVTWLATSKPTPVWNGSAWVTEATSNPGALFLQFVRGYFEGGRLLWGMGKPDAQIDIEGLKAWMLHCEDQGYRFDYWFDRLASCGEVLDAIAAAGLASKSYHTGKLGVVFAAEGQPIEAVVTMGNIKRGTMRVDYATRTTAEELEVAWPERDNSWLASTLRVLAPTVTTPRDTARLSPVGITTQAGALRQARWTMAQNLYGRKSVQWDMDLEHLRFRRWSLVALSHDLTQWGYSGRLHAVQDVAGVVTLTLDAEVPSGATPHVGLRLPGEAAYRVFAVVPFSGPAHTLTLADDWPAGVDLPGADAGDPAHDTLWLFDFKPAPGIRLRVTDIAPNPAMKGARITAVPEPDEFWAYMASGDYTVPVATAAPLPLVASSLRVSQRLLILTAEYATELALSFDVSGPYDHAQVWGAPAGQALAFLGETRTAGFPGWRVAQGLTLQIEVRPFDALGRLGTVTSTTYTVDMMAMEPTAPSGLSYAVHPFGVTLQCARNPEPIVVGYEWRVGASFDLGARIAELGTARQDWPMQTVGTYTVWVAAVDALGTRGPATPMTVVLTAPAMASLAATMVGPDLQLDYTATAGSFAVGGFRLSRGDDFGTAVLIGTVQATRHTRRVDWAGAQRCWVQPVDVRGNPGAAQSVDVIITAPGAPTAPRAEVVDNNALLYWGVPLTGTLPVERYEVRRGASWAAGTPLGSNGNSTFTTYFEQQAGVYTYWVAAVNTAGTVGTAVAINATISQPPDYVLRADFNDDFTGITLSGMHIEDGRIYGPSLGETIQAHFEGRSWATPQDQIIAGYPLVFQPSGASGYVERTMDYGTALPSTIITVTPNWAVLAGAVTMALQLSYKLAAGDAWTDATAGASQVLAGSFRYLKLRMTFTAAGGDDLAEVQGLNIKLSGKLKTDSGSGAALSTDSGGTTVTFSAGFIDVQSIVVTPAGTAARYAVYDFVDVPNPTGFKVLLFDASGTRVSGDFSWTARGY